VYELDNKQQQNTEDLSVVDMKVRGNVSYLNESESRNGEDVEDCVRTLKKYVVGTATY